MRESQTVKLDVKGVTDEGGFQGLAAVYSNTDAAGERIAPGAMTKTLREGGPVYPLLWSHNPEHVIGTVELTDSPRGLQATGKLVLSVAKAKEVYDLLKAGAVRGLSIGYRVITDRLEDGVRVLKELRLFEVSLTSLQSNPLALVHSVKHSVENDRDIAAFKGAARDIADFHRSLVE
jgi:HK97 family phage prohead protease